MADLSQGEGRASVLGEGALAWAAWEAPSTYKAALRCGLSISESGQWVLTVELPGAHSNRCWLLESQHLPLSRRCSCGEGSRAPGRRAADFGATLPVEAPEGVLGQGLTALLLAPDGGGQEKEHTWERQEELGENREARTRRCTAQGSGGRWSPRVQALSSGRLSVSPPRGFALPPVPSGDRHPKLLVS